MTKLGACARKYRKEMLSVSLVLFLCKQASKRDSFFVFVKGSIKKRCFLLFLFVLAFVVFMGKLEARARKHQKEILSFFVFCFGLALCL